MKKTSIVRRFFAYFAVFSFVLVGFIWLLLVELLPRYYEAEQIRKLYNEMERLNTLIKDEQNPVLRIGEFQARTTTSITVYARNGTLIFDLKDTESLKPSDLLQLASGSTSKIVTDGAMSYLQIMKVYESHIYKFVIPYQSLTVATSIIHQFFIFVFFFSMLLALGMALLFSRNISHPLVQLSKTAEKMAQLDFKVRYEAQRTDEIGQLGTTLNMLTEELSKAFDKLKKELAKEKEVEQLRKKFIAEISHELQTPIAIILGTVEAIEDHIASSPEEEVHYLNLMRQEAQKMSHLAKDLLDLSLLESKGFQVQKEHFNYAELVESVVEKAKHMFKEPRAIHFSYQSHHAVLYGDEFRLEQVLINILTNAYTHTTAHGTIDVSVFDHQDFIITEIKNNGQLIDSEDLPHVFERFYKGKNQKKGTGLGLAIVKEIMTLHQGTYSVENKEGWVVFRLGLKK